MTDGVYNGMPAGDLPDLQWRLAGRTPDSAGVEMARLPDGQIAVRNAADPGGPALHLHQGRDRGADRRRAGRRFRRAPRVARPVPQQRQKR